MADILKEVKHYKSKSLPSVPVPDAILYIKSDTDTKVNTYITDINGIPYPLKDDGTIITPGVQTVFNTDGTISVIGTENVKVSLHSSLLALINSSIQPGDNISDLANDLGYLSAIDLDSVETPTEVTIINSAGTNAIILAATTINSGVLLPQDKIKLDNLSNINTGDQDSIVGISGTKAQYNTSLTDGDFLFVGDITQYTDEQAQDSIGTILTDSSTIDFTYDDITPSILANVKPNSITPTELADNINLTEFVNDAGFETTSQLNVRDTNNRNRVNHTGEQPISTVTGLQTALDSKINTSLIGVPNGVAPLDSNNKVPLANTNDALLGNVKWYGLYDGIVISLSPVVALNGTPLPSASSSNTGWYFIAATSFTFGGKDYVLGDWIISNGIIWDKVDNTDSVSTVFGRVGNIIATNGDYDTSLVPDTFDKRYVTDANLVTIGNQSGVNTGDSSVNTTSNAYADAKVEDLLIDGVIDKAPSQNVVYDALQLKLDKSSTSIKTGCTISVGSGSGLISVSPGTFVIADNSTGSTVLTPVTFAGVTDVAAIYPRTILYITSSGTLIQFNGATGDLSPAQRRQNLFIGTFAFDGVNVLAIQNTPNIDYDISQRFNDLTQTLGVRNSEGNVLTANGANLMINKTSGRTFRHMSNYQIDKNIPDITTDNAAIPIPSGINLLAYRNGLGGWSYESYSGSITPTFWDDGTGVKATVANNKFTIPRVYFFNGTDTYIVYLGQKEYGSIDAAIADADRSDRVIDPATSLSSYRGGIAVEKSVTDLQAGIIANTVRFIAPPGGVAAPGGGVVGTENLQGAYNNSVNPEITTDAIRGAFTVRNGQVSDALSVLEGQNIAGSTTFSVTGNGDITGNTYNGYTPEDVSNKVTDIATGANDITYPTSLAVNKYALNLINSKQAGAIGDGITDDTAVLQAYLDNGQGTYIFPKADYLVSGLDINSNSKLIFEKGSRLMLKDNSNRPVLQNKNFSANTDNNIEIYGVEIEGNEANQIKFGVSPPYTGEPTSGLRFFGVENLKIIGAKINKTRTYGIWLSRITNGVFSDIEFNQSLLTIDNQDGIHFNGLCYNIEISNITGVTNDDMIALNTNDVAQGSNVSLGEIKNVTIKDVIFNNNLNGIRLLSAGNLLDQIYINNLSGNVRDNVIAISSYNLGVANFGSIFIDGVNVNTNAPFNVLGEYGGYILVNDKIDFLKISNVFRKVGGDARPTIRIQSRADISKLVIDNVTTVVNQSLTTYLPDVSFEAGSISSQVFISNYRLMNGVFPNGYFIGATNSAITRLHLNNVYAEQIGYGLYLNNTDVSTLFVNHNTSNFIRYPFYLVNDSDVSFAQIENNEWVYSAGSPGVYNVLDTSSINITGSPVSGNLIKFDSNFLKTKSTAKEINGEFSNSLAGSGYAAIFEKTGGFGSALLLRSTSVSSTSLIRFEDPLGGLSNFSADTAGLKYSKTITASPATVDTELATWGQAKALGSSLSVNLIGKWDGTKFVNSNLTDNGSIISGSTNGRFRGIVVGGNGNNTTSLLGLFAGNSNSTGGNWSAIGYQSAYSNVSNSGWVAIGSQSARYLIGGGEATDFENSTYIGTDIKVSSNGVVNENVFGYSASGSGSNTVTLGNTSIVKTVLRGAIQQTTYTVATLPSGTTGMFAVVTDATAPTYLGALTGGGSVVCPVFFDGVSWKSH